MTGNTNGPHLHFSVLQDKNADNVFNDFPDGIVDPYGWAGKTPDPWENYTWQDTLGTHSGSKSSYLFTYDLDQSFALFVGLPVELVTNFKRIILPANLFTKNATIVLADIPIGKTTANDLKSISGDKIVKMGSFIITISDMAKEFNSVLETAPLLKAILTKTSELLGSSKCVIFNVSKDKKTLHMVDAIGYGKEAMILSCNEDSGMAGLSACEGKFYYVRHQHFT